MKEFHTKDVVLIIQQCVNQRACQPHELVRFALAYADATEFAQRFRSLFGTAKPSYLEMAILRWAEMIDPVNHNGYRQGPVSFRDGSCAIHHDTVDRAMFQLCGIVVDPNRPSPDHLYQQFQRIHPFVDGNGRTGHLVWATATYLDTDCWPLRLPPEYDARAMIHQPPLASS